MESENSDSKSAPQEIIHQKSATSTSQSHNFFIENQDLVEDDSIPEIKFKRFSQLSGSNHHAVDRSFSPKKSSVGEFKVTTQEAATDTINEEQKLNDSYYSSSLVSSNDSEEARNFQQLEAGELKQNRNQNLTRQGTTEENKSSSDVNPF